MVKPIGGRGKKAPYETVMVRVPLPIKSQVEKLIANYRDELLSEGEENLSTDQLTELEIANKVVYRFIEEMSLTDKLDVKRYVRSANLVKLIDWISCKMNR